MFGRRIRLDRDDRLPHRVGLGLGRRRHDVRPDEQPHLRLPRRRHRHTPGDRRRGSGRTDDPPGVASITWRGHRLGRRRLHSDVDKWTRGRRHRWSVGSRRGSHELHGRGRSGTDPHQPGVGPERAPGIGVVHRHRPDRRRRPRQDRHHRHDAGRRRRPRQRRPTPTAGKVGISPAGAVTAYLTKVVGGAESTIVQAAVTGLTYTAGTTLRLRLQVVGTSPTALKFKVWKASGRRAGGVASSPPPTPRPHRRLPAASACGVTHLGAHHERPADAHHRQSQRAADDGSAGKRSSLRVARIHRPPATDLTASLGRRSATSDRLRRQHHRPTAWDYGDNTTRPARRRTQATRHPQPTPPPAPTRSPSPSPTTRAPPTPSPTPSPSPHRRADRPSRADAFGRTSASGFGTADSGGAWTVAGTAVELHRVTRRQPGRIRIAACGFGSQRLPQRRVLRRHRPHRRHHPRQDSATAATPRSPWSAAATPPTPIAARWPSPPRARSPPT